MLFFPVLAARSSCLAAVLTQRLSPVGAVPPADGRQTPERTPRAHLLQDQQRVVPVQRCGSSRQPLGPEQRLILERGARPLQHGHLHRSHDPGENHTWTYCTFDPSQLDQLVQADRSPAGISVCRYVSLNAASVRERTSDKAHFVQVRDHKWMLIITSTGNKPLSSSSYFPLCDSAGLLWIIKPFLDM